MPTIIFQFVSQGSSSGGTSIRMRIKHFPLPVSESDVSVQFLDDRIIGSVVVVAASEDETEVVVVSLSIAMQKEHPIVYNENILLANSKPSRSLLFPFAFSAASPSLIAVYPTSGSLVGNVLVIVKMTDFSISSSIGVSFCESLI
jgi:hypothetical protein